MTNFNLSAAAAARYWHDHLSPAVTRPGHLESALLSGIHALQAAGAQPVVFCSRPSAFRSPGFPGVNLLALTAHYLGIPLHAFDAGLLVLYPTQGAELQLHPHGHVRPLLDQFPVGPAPLPQALPPGRISFDPVTQSYFIPLSPNQNDLSNYEVVFSPTP